MLSWHIFYDFSFSRIQFFSVKTDNIAMIVHADQNHPASGVGKSGYFVGKSIFARQLPFETRWLSPHRGGFSRLVQTDCQTSLTLQVNGVYSAVQMPVVHLPECHISPVGLATCWILAGCATMVSPLATLSGNTISASPLTTMLALCVTMITLPSVLCFPQLLNNQFVD